MSVKILLHIHCVGGVFHYLFLTADNVKNMRIKQQDRKGVAMNAVFDHVFIVMERHRIFITVFDPLFSLLTHTNIMESSVADEGLEVVRRRRCENGIEEFFEGGGRLGGGGIHKTCHE